MAKGVGDHLKAARAAIDAAYKSAIGEIDAAYAMVYGTAHAIMVAPAMKTPARMRRRGVTGGATAVLSAVTSFPKSTRQQLLQRLGSKSWNPARLQLALNRLERAGTIRKDGDAYTVMMASGAVVAHAKTPAAASKTAPARAA